MGVNRLFILLVRLLFNSTLLVVKFLGNQKLYTNFQLCGWRGLAPLTSALVKSLVYFILGSRNRKKKKSNYELPNYMATSEQLLIIEGNTDDIITTEIRVQKITNSS